MLGMDVGATKVALLGRIEGEALGMVLWLKDVATEGVLLGRIVGELLGTVLGL